MVSFSAGSVFMPSFRHRAELSAGKSIRQILISNGLPVNFHKYVQLKLNDSLIYEEFFDNVFPKDNSIVQAAIVPGVAGVGVVDKGALRVVGYLASTVFGTVASGRIGGEWGIFARYAITFLGIWLTSNLIAAPEDNEYEFYSLYSSSNTQRPFEAVAKIYGKIRHTPDLCASPYSEIIGDDHFIHLLFCVGYAPLKIIDTRIGSQRIQTYREVESATHAGWNTRSSVDAVLRLYSDGRDVQEVVVDKELKYAPQWNEERTVRRDELHPNVISFITQPDAVRISFDLIFPEGLYNEDGSGFIRSERADISVRFRVLGATGDEWIYLPAPDFFTQDLFEQANIIVDSDFFTDLVQLNAAITEVIAILDAVELGSRILSAGLHRWVANQISKNTALVVTILADGDVDSDEAAILTDFQQGAEELADILDTVEIEADNQSDRLGYFNAQLSLLMTVLTMIDNALDFKEYLNQGAGPDLATLSPFQRWLVARRNLGRVFGYPAEGAFVIVNEDRKAGLFRRGIGWTVSPGQYEVQVRRTDVTVTLDNVHETATIGAYRSFVESSPVSEAVKEEMALMSLRVKATEGFSGSLESVNCLVHAPLPYYRDGSWRAPAFTDSDGEEVSRNPAWIALDMKRGTAARKALPDSIIDLTRWVEFAHFCHENDLFFSGVFYNGDDVDALIDSVLRVGKASRSTRDGKFSVVWDHAQAGYSGMITTTNMGAGMKCTKIMKPVADALRMKFLNADKDYQIDEMMVYRDGFGPSQEIKQIYFFNGDPTEPEFIFPFNCNEVVEVYDMTTGRALDTTQYEVTYDSAETTIASTTTWGEGSRRYRITVKFNGTAPSLVDEVDMFGIVDTHDETSSEHTGLCQKLGRYILASASNRKEIIDLPIDYEAMALERGARIRLSVDTLQIGLGSGRIWAYDVNSSNELESFRLDEKVLLDSGSYGVVIRLHNNETVEGVIASLSADLQTVYLATPIDLDSYSMSGQEMAAWGEIEKITMPVLVVAIRPSEDYEEASVTVVKDDPVVYYADDMLLVPYDPMVTPPTRPEFLPVAPPIITAVKTDEGALWRNQGILMPSCLLSYGRMAPNPDQYSYYDVVAVQSRYRVADFQVVPKPYTVVGYQRDRTGGNRSWITGPTVMRVGDPIQFTNVEQGQTYDFEIRMVDSRSVTSEWVQTDNVTIVGKSSLPPNVENLRVIDGILQWDYSQPPLDLAGFEIRHIFGKGSDWETASVLQLETVSSRRYDLGNMNYGPRVVFVKAVDTSGNYSERAERVTLTNTAPPIETGPETIDLAYLGWPGTMAGFTENSAGELEEDAGHKSRFYRSPRGYQFYRTGAGSFYGSDYGGGYYEFTFEPTESSLPQKLTIEMETTGDDYRLQWKRNDHDLIPSAASAKLFNQNRFFNVFAGQFIDYVGAIELTRHTIVFRLTSFPNDIQTVISSIKLHIEAM